jgi:hypothetical protein
VLALGACLVHRFRHGARATAYVSGSVLWVVSVAAKVALALAVFGSLRRIYGEAIPLVVSIPATGLLTGVTECTFTWLVARRPSWRGAGFDWGVALGLGLGCFEALALAVPMLFASLLGLVPDQLDPQDARALLEGFADPHRPFTFLWERAIAVPVHVLSTVLILRSVRVSKAALFWWGFALKSALDAVPAERIPELPLQAIYGAFGIASTLAFLRFSRAWRAGTAAEPSA